MSRALQQNFAARLVDRLGAGAVLIDARTGEVVAREAIRRAIYGFAAAFASVDLRSGDRLLMVCELTPTSALVYLAAMYCGLVPVPIEARALKSREGVLERTGARVIWTERGVPCDWALRNGCVHLTGRLETSDIAPVSAAPRDVEDLAVLMPTSGSTGAPRLVEVTHGNLIANTEAIIRSQRLSADDRAMLILPLSYCFGASVLHTHLYRGGGVVFDSRFMFPDKVLRAIVEHDCTTFAGVPTAYHILLRRSNLRTLPLPTLRRFLQAGGALAPERIEEMRAIVPHAEFFVMYGQTEATSRIACLPPGRVADKRGSVGVALDNVRVRVVDETGADVAPGASGELWVSGKSICRGYWDDPEASAEKFRDGWLLTGDIASRDDEGCLWIVGRKSEFLKMRGKRVSFAEIEAIIAAAPGIAECAAIAVPHVEAGEAVALYVVAERTAEDVIGEIRRRMPEEWICDSVALVAELPKSSSGKLLRSVLREVTPLHVTRWPTPAAAYRLRDVHERQIS